jgi:hypothetical protein
MQNILARTVGRSINICRSLWPLKILVVAFLTTALGFVAGLRIIEIDILAQIRDKRIRNNPTSIIKPLVQIKEPRVKTELRKFDEGFSADSDWLRHTTFRLENVSGKTIVYMIIEIAFPESSKGEGRMMYPLTLGIRPGSKLQKGDSLLFLPGESMDIELATKHADISRYLSERRSIESVSEIQVEVSFLVFDDGTAWKFGTPMVQDPKKPSRYIPALTLPGRDNDE